MATPPNTLLEPMPTYPVFEANQLLSFRDLNEVRDYLDQQTRLTRVCLTGAGIVCGLVPTSEGNSIVISGGCGVTTEGFLIQVDTCTLTHYQPIEIPRGAFLGKEKSQIDVINAFELMEVAIEESTALTAAFIEGKVVALLLECNDEKNEVCLDDCDEKGTEREFKVRKLLIDHADALAIVEDNFNPILDNQHRRYPDWTLENLLIGRYGLADIYLERFGHTAADGETPAQVKLTNIESYEIFLERYSTIIQAGAIRVADALKRAHVALSPLFSRERPGALPNLPTDRFDIAKLKTERRLEIQYVYDHLADLILAYDEFRCVAFDLMAVCCAETGWFPKHLFLGAPLAQREELPIPPSSARTPYVQPPVYNGNRARVAAVRLMFQRLLVLMESFEVPDPSGRQEVRITPSRWSAAPLSARTIPYYYEPKNDVHRVWNADHHRKARDHQVYSYFRVGAPGSLPNPPYDDPLVFEFEGHDFYRIEGHAGLDKQFAFERIRELRECYNLAFDLVVLKLGEVNQEGFDHDCEFQLLATQYTKLRTDLVCALEHSFPEPPKSVQDLLEELTEALDDFDFDGFQEDFVRVLEQIERSGTCLLGYDLQAFFELFDLHRKRKVEVLEQSLFHKFAEKHPGMEHKAGVPRGGTFILVYDERRLTKKEREEFISHFTPLQLKLFGRIIERELENQTRQTVVADFCLPYLCCADCPPTAYVLSRARPTFLIDPMVFCANDDQEYEFVVDPPGGVIMGRGTRRDGSRYYFLPIHTGVEEGNVNVTYSVDGADTTLTLQILRVPQATFEQIPPVVCYNTLVPLRLATGTPFGGTFTTDIDEGNDQLGIIDHEGQVFFDATVDGVPHGTPIRIAYTVTAENGCTGSSSQQLLVRPELDAGFTGLKRAYCDTDEPSELKPDDSNLTSQFVGNGVDDSTFYPGSAVFKGLQTRVTITHTVTDEYKCHSSFARETTVYRQQEGGFEAGRPRRDEQIIVPVRNIRPTQLPGGSLKYHFFWIDSEGVQVDEPPRKDSKDFELLVPFERVEGMDVLRVILVVVNGECSSVEVVDDVKLSFDDEREDDRSPIELEDRRRALDRERLRDIAASNRELDQTKTFQLADGLVDVDRSRSTDELVDEFANFVTTLTRGYSRLDSDERKTAYRTLAKIVAGTIIDRVAVEPPDTSTHEKAGQHLQKLSEVELDLDALRDEWLGDELAGVLDGVRIDVVRTLFD